MGVYKAIITQDGTSDPEVVVFENTIGNIVWTRHSTGLYFGTLEGAFHEFETWCVPCVALGIAGGKSHGVINRYSDDAMVISTESDYDTPSDGILFRTPIVIETFSVS